MGENDANMDVVIMTSEMNSAISDYRTIAEPMTTRQR